MNIKEYNRYLKYIKINPITNCHEWQGALDKDGYGKIRLGSIKTRDRRLVRTHRASFIHENGDIPSSVLVCHKCDNPKCSNPKHLFAGTNKSNSDDKIAKGRANFGNRKGSSNAGAKLNDQDVKNIKKLLLTLNNKELARLFNVHHSTISLIRTGKRWSHL